MQKSLGNCWLVTCCDFVVRYRPMRGGQMTPPDVVVRGRDDQISARMAWNQASLSMSSFLSSLQKQFV